MIIVSQDKTQILNFNNIQKIKIEPNGINEEGKKIYSVFAGNFEGYVAKLGNYDTEERAKEVLQELAQTLCLKSKVNITSDSIDLSTEEIYYMPKE